MDKQGLVDVLRYQRSTLGRWTFSVAAPTVPISSERRLRTL